MNLFGDSDYLEKLSLNSKVANRVYPIEHKTILDFLNLFSYTVYIETIYSVTI